MLRRRNTVTDSRAPYKPQINTMETVTVHAGMKMESQILDANRNVFRSVLELLTDEELRMEHGN